MVRTITRRAALSAAGLAILALASPTAAQNASGQSRLVAFLPPAPAGWVTSDIVVTEDINGMEPMASLGYVRDRGKGAMSITITRPSPHDLATAFAPRPLGPSPFVPGLVTSRVKVNGMDAYLAYDATGPGGTLEMKVGRVKVGITGGEVPAEQIMALARSIDTARLVKY